MKNLLILSLVILFIWISPINPSQFTLEEQMTGLNQSARARLKYHDYMDLQYSEILQQAQALDKRIHQGEIVLTDAAIASMNILDLHRVNPKAAKKKLIESANPMNELEPVIQHAAKKHKLEAHLIKAVIKQESDAKNGAISHEGARGLMQLMPDTARRMGVRDSHDPIQNIDGGAKYLKWLLVYFKGNKELALAAYNAGMRRVIDAGYQIPPIEETQKYVVAVMSNYRRYVKEA
jgi:soluble lytic murein transglycosylase-like protein